MKRIRRVVLWVGMAAVWAGGRGVAGEGRWEGVSQRLELPPTIPPEMRLVALPLRVAAPVDNPTTKARSDLGRLLFFDPVLSSSGDVSCATCHNPRFGWADGRALPLGVGGNGAGPSRTLRSPVTLPVLDRNTPTLLNVGFNGLVSGEGVVADPAGAPMFWDARVRGLEQQVFIPLRSRGEMCGQDCDEAGAVPRLIRRLEAIAEYRQRFAEAFGQPARGAVTSEHLAKAIAAFERTLVTPPTAVDRFLAGDGLALNAEQQRGLRAFQDAGCIHCHGGPMFSDYKLHFIGVADAARVGRREMRTPTLRNLRHTAPYMHDGSLRTVREVLVFYEELAEAVSETLDGGAPNGSPTLDPLLKHLNLNAEDYPALESFLDALSSPDYDQTAPAKVPSGIPVEL